MLKVTNILLYFSFISMPTFANQLACSDLFIQPRSGIRKVVLFERMSDQKTHVYSVTEDRSDILIQGQVIKDATLRIDFTSEFNRSTLPVEEYTVPAHSNWPYQDVPERKVKFYPSGFAAPVPGQIKVLNNRRSIEAKYANGGGLIEIPDHVKGIIKNVRFGFADDLNYQVYLLILDQRTGRELELPYAIRFSHVDSDIYISTVQGFPESSFYLPLNKNGMKLRELRKNNSWAAFASAISRGDVLFLKKFFAENSEAIFSNNENPFVLSIKEIFTVRDQHLKSEAIHAIVDALPVGHFSLTEYPKKANELTAFEKIYEQLRQSKESPDKMNETLSKLLDKKAIVLTVYSTSKLSQDIRKGREALAPLNEHLINRILEAAKIEGVTPTRK